MNLTRIESVTSPPPPQFPILVITPHYVTPKELLTPLEVLKCTLSSGDDASVVLQENLAAFTEKHKDYTFLVLPGAVEELNRQLRKQEVYNEPVIASESASSGEVPSSRLMPVVGTGSPLA